MRRRYFHRFLLILAVCMALSQTACTPLECDPEAPEFDPEDCETLLGVLLEFFTGLAFGTFPPDSSPGNVCPAPLVCQAPDCFGPVQENGNFEEPPVPLEPPAMWHGDQAETSALLCRGSLGLSLQASTPDGPGASTAAQVFQVFDYRTLLPEARHAALRHVRVQASVHVFVPSPGESHTFGIRIHAYAGDPATFPRAGDPEQFLSTVPGLLAATFETTTYVDGETWQPARADLWLPEGTDYFVVFVEVHEEGQNETMRDEFMDHYIDDVQVVIDVGNQPPLAVDDERTTPESTSVTIAVLLNDRDNTSYLDPASVTIGRAPANGMAQVLPNGKVVYTPDNSFVGTDTFAYRVADEEGLVSNDATVTITVLEANDPPAAADDVYAVPDDGLLIVPTPTGILANDTDPNGDALTAVLVRDVEAGNLRLDPSGSFTFTAPPSFTGTTFTYVADDGRGATSSEATVTLAAGSGYDLEITKTVAPDVVPHSNEATFTVVVTNHGPGNATGVQVMDFLGFGFTHQSASTTQGTYATETGLWNVGDMIPGQQATLTITGLVHISLVNTATITSGLADDTDDSNNEAQASVTTQ